MCWLLLSSFSLCIICMLQQQQQHIRMFIIIVFIFLSFKWFNLIRRVIKNHSAKVRRNPHSHNTLCMAFLYTKDMVYHNLSFYFFPLNRGERLGEGLTFFFLNPLEFQK